MGGPAVVTLDPWQGLIDGLLIGPGTVYDVVEVAGLEELPEIRTDDDPYPTGDGEFTGVDYASGRTVTFRLEVVAGLEVGYVEALAALRWVCRPKREVEVWFHLPTWDGPRWLTGKVRRFAIPTDVQFEMGLATADVQVRAADSILYSAQPAGLTTGFPVPAGGLQYPLYTDGAGTDLGYLDYGAPSPTGRLVLSNPGTASTWPVYTVTGPVPAAGFALVRTDTGDRIQFEDPLADGAVLVLDSATGTAMVDVSADRGGRVTFREWFPVEARSSVEVAFVPLGPVSPASLSVFAPPGWW